MSGTASAAAGAQDSDARMFALACYGLYLAAIVFLPAVVVAVVLAYVKRADLKGTIWESHFTNLIHVFWTSVVACTIWLAVLMTGVFGIWSGVQHDAMPWLVGIFPAAWLIALLLLVWYVYRIIRGFLRATDRLPYA